MSTVDTIDGVAVMAFEDAGAWESWLAASHARQPAVWLKIARKGSGLALLTINEALEVALCYGWIDSQRRSLDDASYLQRYSPRGPKSAWSKVNVAKVEVLTAAGRMREPGIAAVEAAKSDGRWAAAYESQRNVTAPADLAAALNNNERAAASFAALGKTARYGVILPLLTARTADARRRRLLKAVSMLEADAVSAPASRHSPPPAGRSSGAGRTLPGRR